MTKKFVITNHNMVHSVSNRQRGDQNSFEHMQKLDNGVIGGVKKAEERSKNCDFKDICTMPNLEGNLHGNECAT